MAQSITEAHARAMRHQAASTREQVLEDVVATLLDAMASATTVQQMRQAAQTAGQQIPARVRQRIRDRLA